VNRALEGLTRFPPPVGPFVDVYEHHRAEAAWLASLDESDALDLLAWADEPTPLAGWADHWMLYLRRHAIEYAGDFYARTHSTVIREALARLARHAELRDAVTEELEPEHGT
jgi:hypothetical protein